MVPVFKPSPLTPEITMQSPAVCQALYAFHSKSVRALGTMGAPVTSSTGSSMLPYTSLIALSVKQCLGHHRLDYAAVASKSSVSMA